MKVIERSCASGGRNYGSRQSLNVVMAQHITRVLEMVDFDLQKASELLEIELSELVLSIARLNVKPNCVPKTGSEASIHGEGQIHGDESANGSQLSQ